LFLLISGLVIKKRPVKFSLFALVFFIIITIPNIILYAKSGLVERYLLPSSFGLGFLVATFIKDIVENPQWLKKLALIFVFVSFLPYLVTSYTEAKEFSNEGFATKKLLSAISINNVNGPLVMVIVDPVESYEKSVSLKTYLYYEDKIDLFGYYIINKDIKDTDQGYVDGWKSYFDKKLFENLTSPPGLLIFLDNKLIEELFSTSELSRSEYLNIEIGDSQFALFKKVY
jgi:hypothetical protein